MKIEAAQTGRMELHDLIGTAMGPLPIAFVSTVGPDGTYNAAPFSFAAPVCSKPAILCISIGYRKQVDGVMNRFVDDLDETQLNSILKYKNYKGEYTEKELWKTMLHWFNHQTHH